MLADEVGYRLTCAQGAHDRVQRSNRGRVLKALGACTWGEVPLPTQT